MSVSPILLVIVSLVGYQVAARLSPTTVTSWMTLSVAYAIALTICLARVVAHRHGIVANELADARFLATGLVLGVAVVGIEYGYLAAHRSGWELATVGLVGAAGGTAVLAIVGAAVFSEGFDPRRILGFGLCVVGLALLAWRHPGA